MNTEYIDIKDKMKVEHDIEPRTSLAVTFMPLDLSSFTSTLNFVQLYQQSGRKLHALILNAGIGMAPYGNLELHIFFIRRSNRAALLNVCI